MNGKEFGAVAAIALALAAGAGAAPAAAATAQAAAANARVTEEQLRQVLESQPEFRGTYTAFREEFPQDYQAFLTRMTATANAQGAAAAGVAAFHFMRRFMGSRVEDIAAAPDADLDRLADANVSLSRALRGYSVPLCAQFVMSGFSPGVRLSPEILARLDAANTIQLHAAAHAIRGPRVARGPLSPDLAGLWIRRMWALDPASAALLTEGRMETATPAEQCNAGIMIYQAAAELPAEQGGLVTAHLVRESFRQLMSAEPH